MVTMTHQQRGRRTFLSGHLDLYPSIDWAKRPGYSERVAALQRIAGAAACIGTRSHLRLFHRIQQIRCSNHGVPASHLVY